MSKRALPAPKQQVAWDKFEPIQDGQVEYSLSEVPARSRKALGRAGMDDVFKIVSSGMARDIKRNKNWIADEPFKLWNDKDMKANGGKQRYWGQLEDYDNDGLPIEYVVRRGSEKGPIVAVNGYTTARSDYPWRYQYYNSYPTKEDRKDKPYDDFLNEYMESTFGAQYDDDNMTIKDWSVKNPYDDDSIKKIIARGYTNPLPKDKSPYKVFSSIVYKLINEIILEMAGGDAERAKETRKAISEKSGKGMGFASVIASAIYDAYITSPIINFLNSNGLLSQYMAAFEALRQQRNPKYKFDQDDKQQAAAFSKWLTSKADYKKAAKKLAAQYISNDKIDATSTQMKQDIMAHLQALIK